MSLRKNARQVLEDVPPCSELLHYQMEDSLLIRDIAKRRRVCRDCAAPILQGEEHLVSYHVAKHLLFPVRTNICCLCAPRRLNLLATYYNNRIKYIRKQLKKCYKYSEMKNLKLKNSIHHQF